MWRRQSSPAVAAVENSVEIPRVFLDKVVDMPVGVQRQVLGLWLRSCSSSTVMDVPVIVRDSGSAQIQFIADMVDIPARNRDRYLTLQWQR